MCQSILWQIRPLVVAALFLASGPAFGTAQRTFVASNGNDGDPCSLTAPCRSFAAALAKTSAFGEVIVQDSAGYGPVSVGQSVSIISPPGIYAGIAVFSGDGIAIAGVDIEVVLRGLSINGPGTGNGINFLQGRQLTVENCEISRMSHGIEASAPGSKTLVKHTVLRGNLLGFLANAALDAVLDGVHATANAVAGIEGSGGARVTIANSVLANNDNFGVIAFGNGAVADVMVTHSTITGSPIGIYALASAGGTARLVADGNAINNSVTTAFAFGGGVGTETIYSPGNNTIGFNNGIVAGGSFTPLTIY